MAVQAAVAETVAKIAQARQPWSMMGSTRGPPACCLAGPTGAVQVTGSPTRTLWQ